MTAGMEGIERGSRDEGIGNETRREPHLTRNKDKAWPTGRSILVLVCTKREISQHGQLPGLVFRDRSWILFMLLFFSPSLSS